MLYLSTIFLREKIKFIFSTFCNICKKATQRAPIPLGSIQKKTTIHHNIILLISRTMEKRQIKLILKRTDFYNN